MAAAVVTALQATAAKRCSLLARMVISGRLAAALTALLATETSRSLAAFSHRSLLAEAGREWILEPVSASMFIARAAVVLQTSFNGCSPRQGLGASASQWALQA